MHKLSDHLPELLRWNECGDGSLEGLLQGTGLTAGSLSDLRSWGLLNPGRPRSEIEAVCRALHESTLPQVVADTLVGLDADFGSPGRLHVDLWPMDPADHVGRTDLRGISANVGYDGVMTLVIDPGATPQAVQETVAHEFHHHLRMAWKGLREEEETLLRRLVMEGMAEHFVEVRLGQSSAPWLVGDDDESLATLWPLVQANLYAPGDSEVARSIMFGDAAAGIPHWLGYSIGYHIVQAFLVAHPELTLMHATLLPDERFVPADWPTTPAQTPQP